MSFLPPPAIIHSVIFIADGLFSGLKLFIPVVFLISITKFNFGKQKMEALFITSNILLLIGGILFCIALTSSGFNSFLSEDAFGKTAFINMITGPHWFQFVLPAICYGLIPNIMWNKKIRRSIFASIFVLISWFLAYAIVIYFSYRPQNIFSFPIERLDFHVPDFSYKMIVFAALAVPIYLIVRNKTKAG